MFTKNQLEMLLSAQYEDDWHVDYFATVLKNSDFEEIDPSERETLIDYVSSLPREEVWNLQMALNHLNQIPSFKD